MKQEDFRQIISLAIDVEMEAYSFYCAVADTVANDGLKNIFAGLADAELHHQNFLQQIMLKGSRAQYVEESFDYKASDGSELPALSMSLKPVEGILLAIRKKLDAIQMYTQLSEASQDLEVKSAFLELAKMKKNQKAHLEDIYAKMQFPEAW
jgi:rubrerythrin